MAATMQGPGGCLGFLGTLHPAVENVATDKEAPAVFPLTGLGPRPRMTPFLILLLSQKVSGDDCVLSSCISFSPFGFPCL